jgi:hypothetical protein
MTTYSLVKLFLVPGQKILLDMKVGGEIWGTPNRITQRRSHAFHQSRIKGSHGSREMWADEFGEDLFPQFGIAMPVATRCR